MDPLRPRYMEVFLASGLVDEIEDIDGLDPRPIRRTEGEFICRRGDQAENLWVIFTGAVFVKYDKRTLCIRRQLEGIG